MLDPAHDPPRRERKVSHVKLGKMGEACEDAQGARTMRSEQNHAQLLGVERVFGYTHNMPESAGTSRAWSDATCVVWNQSGADLKPALLAGLNRPGFTLLHCDDEFSALAQVCALAREARDSSARSRLIVLLLVEPLELVGVVSVVEAVGRYAPGVAVWMYGSSSDPQLRTVRAHDLAQWRQMMPPPSPADVPKEPPVVEVPPTSPARAPASPSAETPVAIPAPQTPVVPRLLTDEELAMLLEIEPKPEQGKDVQ